MMCINTRSFEFQVLKDKSGLKESDLEIQVGVFQQEHGRWPNLDEIKGADSYNYIKDFLKLNKNNATKIQDVLDVTNTTDLKEAVIQLNNEFRDKEISFLPLGETVIVNIKQRPNTSEDISEDIYDQDDEVNNTVILNTVIDKLQDLYGINIHYIEDPDEFMDLPGASNSKAFIYNGEIYINTQNATIDSPLHEMLHLIFGSIKYQQPDLYYTLIEQAENFSTYNKISKLYPNRTRGDLNEEVFITELAKYLSGISSALDDIDSKIMYDISYNMYRLLDTVLMGGTSVKAIQEPVLYNLTLKQVAHIVNSPIAQNTFKGSLDDAAINRIMANTKQELLENGELKEDCG